MKKSHNVLLLVCLVPLSAPASPPKTAYVVVTLAEQESRHESCPLTLSSISPDLCRQMQSLRDLRLVTLQMI